MSLNTITISKLRDKFDFGKYKGKIVKEVIDEDPFYVNWANQNVGKVELGRKAKKRLENSLDEHKSESRSAGGMGRYPQDDWYFDLPQEF